MPKNGILLEGENVMSCMVDHYNTKSNFKKDIVFFQNGIVTQVQL